MGAALVFTPNYIIVGKYFDKKKGMAMSLGTVGSGLGSFILPPLFVFLFHHYGYFGCMFMFAAIMGHACIAGNGKHSISSILNNL